jgi:hypothetical protein
MVSENVLWSSENEGFVRREDMLRRCYEQIRELKEENRQLRIAAESFGHLAERLNRALRAERRLRAIDHLATPREMEPACVSITMHSA